MLMTSTAVMMQEDIKFCTSNYDQHISVQFKRMMFESVYFGRALRSDKTWDCKAQNE